MVPPSQHLTPSGVRHDAHDAACPHLDKQGRRPGSAPGHAVPRLLHLLHQLLQLLSALQSPQPCKQARALLSDGATSCTLCTLSSGYSDVLREL